MSKLFAILGAVAVSAVALAPGHADACSCISTTLENSFEGAKAVVVVTPIATWVAGQNRFYSARVHSVFKGNASVGELVYVKTSLSSASCGVTLGFATPHLLNAYGVEWTYAGRQGWMRMLSTGLCSMNQRWDDVGFAGREFLYGQKACATDAVCGSDAFCAGSFEGSARKCRPFAAQGEACGGYTPPDSELRCAAGLECVDQHPDIMDEPGICERRAAP